MPTTSAPARLHFGLQPRLQIRRRAQPGGPAARDDVRPSPPRRQFSRQIRHHTHEDVVFGGVDQPHLGAQQMVQQQVALDLLRLLPREHQDGLPAEDARRGRGHPGVVGLQRADGDDHVRALRAGLPQQQFQFARLVAAQRQTGQVVPFDQNAWAAQVGGETRRLLQRRGTDRQRQAGEVAELHG